jgi:hypothetical protein
VWATNATTIAGSPMGDTDSTSTTLSAPSDVWIDHNNYIYILDNYNYRVQLYLPGSASGITILNSSFGSELNQFGDSK